MKRNFVAICLLALSAMVVFAISDHRPVAAQGTGSAVPPLMLFQKAPLDNHLGRIDHIWLSENAGFYGSSLFFSFLGANGVGVYSLFDGKQVALIPGIRQPEGECVAPGYNELFTGSAAGKLYIFDSRTFKLKKTIQYSSDVDDEGWDPVHKVVVIGEGGENDKNGGIVEVSPATNQQVGRVLKTGGHPERFQFELHGPMLYVNVPTKGNVVDAFNRNTGAMRQWHLHGVTNNFAMTFDEAHHRLFTVARNIPTLVVLNSDTGQEVARVTGIAGEVDDAYFDSARNRIYLIGGTGTISVVQEITPDRYGLIANIPSKVGARTGWWSQRESRLYVAVQAEDGQPPAIYVYDAQD